MRWMSLHNKWLMVMIPLLSLIFSGGCFGLSFPLPALGDDIVGEIQVIHAKSGDTLSSLGLKHNIGYAEMWQANPELPRHRPLALGSPVIIPAQFILPTIRQGLVVNLAELRVYYFPQDDNWVHIFPIGAGKKGWQTPTAITEVITKVKDPAWIVPASIKQESARRGKRLPDVVPPGPNNPLGRYALRLGLPGILMHGTLAPASIGQRSSHGCLRMLADDIKFLYEHVPVGTPVNIIHQHNKIGWLHNQLYLEAEVPFDEYDDSLSLQSDIQAKIARQQATVDWQQVNKVLEQQDGMPHVISNTLSSSIFLATKTSF